MARLASRTPRTALAVACCAAGIGIGVAAGPAGAAPGWSATPTSALPGTAVRVASDASTLCQWRQPTTDPTVAAAAGDDPVVTAAPPTAVPAPSAAADGEDVFDGIRVELRLEADGTATALGDVPVVTGGAWSGTVTVPSTATAGEYDLLARCVVDDPALDGVRTFDFDPIAFTVVEGPPPTTVTIPTELIPPITAVNPTLVEGEQTERPAPAPSGATSASGAAAVPTLPNTGDGTLAVALAGFGAVGLGLLALWYGTRAARRSACGVPD